MTQTLLRLDQTLLSDQVCHHLLDPRHLGQRPDRDRAAAKPEPKPEPEDDVAVPLVPGGLGLHLLLGQPPAHGCQVDN